MVGRGLLGGAAGGALLGAGVQAGDVAYRSWGSVAFAGGVGALVALPAALAAVVVHLMVVRRGVRLAWLASGLAAAVAVLVTGALLGVLANPTTVAAAAVAFTVALASAKIITTQRTPRGSSEGRSATAA